MRRRIDMTDLVENHTGWPRRQCRQIIGHFYRRHWLTTIALPTGVGLSFFWGWMYGYAAILEALEARGSNAARLAIEWPWIAFPLLLASGMGLAVAGQATLHLLILRFWMRRYTRRYLEQPMCLACCYPISTDAGACPECGTSPPRHLVEWAARRR